MLTVDVVMWCAQALDTIKQWVLASPSLSALAIDSEVVSGTVDEHHRSE